MPLANKLEQNPDFQSAITIHQVTSNGECEEGKIKKTITKGKTVIYRMTIYYVEV